MKTVYVAGPYTSGDTSANVRHAVLTADKLVKAKLIPFVPHLYHLWDMVSPHDYEHWMKLDLAWLLKCDALLRIGGVSPGAQREVAYAKEEGIPVFHDVGDVIRWARKEEA